MIYHVFITEDNANVELLSTEFRSSKSLLLTLLGELVLRNGSAAWTQTFLQVMGSLGVEEKAARQAINRAAERDWLNGSRVGRRTRWSLTPEIRRVLRDGAERIYGFGQEVPEWNGQWLLVNASLPERQRNLRYRVTSGMNWAGFGSLGHGWWISPRTDREHEIKQVLIDAGIRDSTSFVASHGSMGDPADLAQRGWNLDEIHQEYQSFLDLVDRLSSNHGTDSLDSARDLVRLTHQWRRLPLIDPLLPRQLLPPDWLGETAATQFRHLHDRLSHGAEQWWRNFEDQLAR